MLTRIKLMADYNYYPLWDMDEPGDIDPSELPLSDGTVERLLKWQHIYDGTMNWDDPYLAGFPSEEERVAFEREGISLWLQVQKELGDECEVVYFSELQGRVLRTPEEAIQIASLQKAETA